MQRKAILLTIILSAFSLSCWSNALPQSFVPSPESKHLESKKIWLVNMQKNLPSLLCQKEHYFVQCFETDEAACLELTTLLVQSCLNNVSQIMPDQLTSNQVSYWGQVVGRCSFDVYQRMRQDKKRHTPACHETLKDQENLPKPAKAIP